MNYYALAKNNNEHSPIFGKYTALCMIFYRFLCGFRNNH